MLDCSHRHIMISFYCSNDADIKTKTKLLRHFFIVLRALSWLVYLLVLPQWCLPPLLVVRWLQCLLRRRFADVPGVVISRACVSALRCIFSHSSSAAFFEFGVVKSALIIFLFVISIFSKMQDKLGGFSVSDYLCSQLQICDSGNDTFENGAVLLHIYIQFSILVFTVWTR